MSCSVPVVDGTVVRDRMWSRARTERVPIQADIEIIGTCNFRCVHCYIAPVSGRDDVMSLDEARAIFDKLAAAGTLTVLLTGGEIFTHRQFKDIYLAAKRSGFIVLLNTNAYMIGERWADFLAEYPARKISISLYGMSPASYERLTGIPNSYQRVMRAIDLLQDRGLHLDLKCPALTLTSDELPVMAEFARQRGLPFRYDPVIVPQRDGSATPLDLQLSPDAAVDLTERMDPGLEVFRTFAEPRLRPNDGSVYGCGAGRTGLAINVRGGVSTCITSRQIVANLLEQSFDEVWDILGGKVERRFPDGHPCATCRFRGMCAGCPATVEQLTGLPEGYVQEYCKITHRTAQRLGYHQTGVPRTVTEGIPQGVQTPERRYARALPVVH